MTRPRTLRPVSRLIWRVWELPDVGRVTAVTPTAALLAQADGTWPGLRLRTDWHHHWRWANLMEGMEERFGLIDAAGHPVALWCGPPRRLLRLPTGAAYRLDYFEIDPRHRRGSLGLFAFALAGSRALELGAQLSGPGRASAGSHLLRTCGRSERGCAGLERSERLDTVPVHEGGPDSVGGSCWWLRGRHRRSVSFSRRSSGRSVLCRPQPWRPRRARPAGWREVPRRPRSSSPQGCRRISIAR